MGPDVETVRELKSLPPRHSDAHKGDFGRVLVVGGSGGMIGAPALAATAALRAGAGLVTIAAPAPVQLTVAALCPCATSIPLRCDADGQLHAEAVRQVVRAAEACDVLAVGPGLAVGGVQRDLIQAVLQSPRCVVLDADGLNNLASLSDWPSLRLCPLVATPHPGEFARLTGRSVAEVQADRTGAAVQAARQWNGPPGATCPPPVCLLKGAGTVVTDGRRVYVNDTGNPGMATGGTGDVLTGLLAALVAQDLSPFDAACLAAWLHGRAGDLAAEKFGETSLIASDLLDFLPQAIREHAA